jgi:hypothetical protein
MGTCTIKRGGADRELEGRGDDDLTSRRNREIMEEEGGR